MHISTPLTDTTSELYFINTYPGAFNMKFTAAKTNLVSSVSIALRAVPAHTTMNILQCIFIESSGAGLKLTGNDTELGIETYMPATIEIPGKIAVDAKMLSEIVRKLPDEIVTFSSDENYMITISCGKATFMIPGKSGEDFTELPVVERDDSITMTQFTLKSLILQTIFSIAQKDNNKIMTGECFEVNGSLLRVIALDGHRISMRRVALKEEASVPKRVIIPGKTLLEISRILSGEIDDIVTIFFARNHVVFEIPGTRIVSRLIDGEYFNIDQMISTDYQTKLIIPKAALQGCIERSLLFVRENDKKPIIFDMAETELRLSVQSPLGSFDETLDVTLEGKGFSIGFNPRFMLDALKVLDDETVTLYLVNSKAPCFIRDEDETYTYIVLPVNFVR